jgi:hypothetical protein
MHATWFPFLPSCFLISHAHLDHVAGLILSAGSLHGCRKRVCAPPSALKTLETIFSDRIWPNLASWDEDDAPFKLLYRPLKFDDAYQTVFRDSVSVRAMPVLHGQNDTLGDYQSSAFFVRHDVSGQQFLFFGDVAPDSLATHAPQTIAVWRAAAPLIPHTLSTLFIECSWPSGRLDDQLYGHLSPEHLVDELVVLAAEVTAARLAKAVTEGAVTADGSADVPPPEPEPKRRRKRRKRRRKMSADPPPPPLGPLAGLRVYIIHCKEDLEGKYDRPISEVIRDQVDALVRAKGLGAEVLSADQGMTISTLKISCRVYPVLSALF